MTHPQKGAYAHLGDELSQAVERLRVATERLLAAVAADGASALALEEEFIHAEAEHSRIRALFATQNPGARLVAASGLGISLESDENSLPAPLGTPQPE